jgi:hypothetical protein
MVEALENIQVMDGDSVAPEHIPTALTAEGFVYGVLYCRLLGLF